MFTIDHHMLSGTSPQDQPLMQTPSGNHNGSIQPKFLVFHYTACSAQAAANAFTRAQGSNRVSAHLLVDAAGGVTQFIPLNLRAWHAGPSEWAGFRDLNTHSIGIEVENYGYLNKLADGTFRTAEGNLTIDPQNVIEARHRLAHWPWLYWNAYTPAQIATCQALAALLVPAYGLRDVVGHDDIAPARKSDPGPAFPLSRIRSTALGRDNDVDGHDLVYVAADKLNIRTGAGIAFPKAGPPLPRNLPLKVLHSDPGGWLHVLSHGQPPVQGWVAAGYTSSALT